MLYSIVSEDVANSLAKRQMVRPAHIKRLHELRDEGRLILGGPNPTIDTTEPGEAGFSGSVVIAEFDSLEDAKKWAAADPYFASGAYKSVVVKPFKKVLP